MEILTEMEVEKTAHSRLSEVNFDKLEFGKTVADHMLVCDFKNGEWHQPRIEPFGNFSISPSTAALHYGQTVFEGMKAFRTIDGRINIFRIDRHYDRFKRSLERMCMAVPSREIFVDGLLKLIEIDKDWIPGKQGSSLYIRPFEFASETIFGVKVSENYRFVIFTGPVPSLFAKPIRVKVETQYVRAARGGTGYTKCGGNYGGAYYPTKLAKDEGYDQVLWTDAKEHNFIEESGMMNIMFVIGGNIVTPPLSDSILDGITRDSLLTIAKDMNIKIEERPVGLDELRKAFESTTITEAFGVGTAAVVAPIETIQIHGADYKLPVYNKASIFDRLKSKLEAIRLGTDEDVYGWNTYIP